jgi:hypothetical protein
VSEPSPTSNLESFIERQRDSGHHESEGVFTLSAEKALERLAGFQLPDGGDWIRKVVQAIVRSGSRVAIRIALTRKQTEISFLPGRSWSIDEVVDAFHHFEHRSEPDMEHLKVALWAVAAGEARSVRLTLPGCKEQLVWDGRWSRSAVVAAPDKALLCVGHSAPIDFSNPNWLSQGTLAASRNAEILTALQRHCYVCPLPLVVDGLRLDALRCSSEGQQGSLIHLETVNCELPALALPRRVELGNIGLNTVSGEQLRGYKPPRGTQLAIMIGAYQRAEADRRPAFRGVPSVCHWVRDGVVVEEQRFDNQLLGCAVTALLSAEGLNCDLSGLALRQQPERDRRLRLAARLIGLRLGEMKPPELTLSGQGVTAGTILKTVGTFVVLLNPLHPITWTLGSLAGLAGWGMDLDRNQSRDGILEHVQETLKELRRSWSKAWNEE